MSLFNWAELQHLRYVPPGRGPGSAVDWDAHADMYTVVSELEEATTLRQLDAFPTTAQDTVLDIGCGPGRIAIPMAARAASVTAMDNAPQMLEACRARANTAGVTNLIPLGLDWQDAVAGQNVAQHDVVICSRTAALGSVERLSSFARKRVAVITWANAPSIPTIIDRLFDPDADPSRATPDRRLGYNVLMNIVYDQGYEPNVHIVDDDLTRDFPTAEEEYAYLRRLRSGALDAHDLARFQRGVDRCSTVLPGGGRRFHVRTRSVVIWWDVDTPVL